MALHVLLLLTDEAPQLVKLKALGAHADHDPVVQLHAAHADTERQVGDGAAVNAGQAGCGTDADAFANGGDDLNLLLAG